MISVLMYDCCGKIVFLRWLLPVKRFGHRQSRIEFDQPALGPLSIQNVGTLEKSVRSTGHAKQVRPSRRLTDMMEIARSACSTSSCGRNYRLSSGVSWKVKKQT